MLNTDKCALCLEKTKLKDSHVFSDYMWKKMPDDKVLVSDTLKTLPSLRPSEYLLCGKCEQLTGKYENYLKQIVYVEDPYYYALNNENNSNSSYNIYNINTERINIAISIFLYKFSVAENAFGAGQKLERENKNQIRQNILSEKTSPQIKIKILFHSFMGQNPDRYEHNILLAHKRHLNEKVKKYNPIWIFIFGLYTFIIEEEVLGGRKTDITKMPDLLEKENEIKVNLAEGRNLIKTYLIDRKIPTSWTGSSLKELYNNLETCFLCGKKIDKGVCCREKYMEEYKYYCYKEENGKTFLNPIDFFLVKDNYSKKTENLYVEKKTETTKNKKIVSSIEKTFGKQDVEGEKPIIRLRKDKRLYEQLFLLKEQLR